jgi:RNA-binding protein YlmH
MLPETKEDKLLLSVLADRFRQCEDKMYPVNSDFLDMRQQSLAEEQFLRKTAGYCFWGGYADAERRIMIFLPDYLDWETARANYGKLDPEGDPLVVLRACSTAKQTDLSHRDYLGALMSLGINRSKLGDIIVRDNGADIVILRELADYLLLNYERVGRYTLECEILPTSELAGIEATTKELSVNVSSLRLDSVAAAAFGVSRSKTADAISAKLLAVNNLQVTKTDILLSEGDVLTWKGKGKAKLAEVGGKTRKERIWITISKYI